MVRVSFIITSIISVILSFGIHAQSDTSFRPVRIIKGDIVDYAVDNLDDVYILSSTDQIKKIDAKGDSVAVFNDVKRFGKIFTIDVSDPLRLLLYYKDFSSIVILDRLLNVRNNIDLRKQNIYQVSAICQSYDNKIWLYDEVDNKLKKIDEDGKVLSETPDFRLLFGYALAPQKIFDQDKLVYLYDSAKGVFVFDYYGSFRNRIQITGWQDFKVVDKYIFGTNDNILHRYQIRTFNQQEQQLPAHFQPYTSLNFTATRLYALRKNAIEIYSFR